MHLGCNPTCYCQVRVKQTIDASVTVKFALISWVGEEVAPMRTPNLLHTQTSPKLQPSPEPDH